MSEADRVFSGRRGQGAQAPFGEKRHIVTAPRRSGPGAGKSRVVEVVHVRRDGARPVEDHPPPAPWNQRAETWPEDLQAKQDLPPAVPEAAPPVVHVMPMWEPSAPQPEPPVVEPCEASVEPAMAGQHRPRTPKAKTPKGTARHFADPFADADEGANCLRCGYLVEPARERRGLLTCSSCG
jgi:hypothetical protein